jgi:hypothetical protein
MPAPRTLLLLLVSTSCATAVVPPAPVTPPAGSLEAEDDEPARIARSFASELAAHDFARAATHFDQRLAVALSPSALSEQWSDLSGDLGAFRQLSIVREEERPAGAKAVLVSFAFERDSLTLAVVVNAERRVSGLRPASPHARETYVRSAQEFLDLLVARDWPSAAARLNQGMLKALPAEQLAKVFEEVRAETGDPRTTLGVKVESIAQGAIVDLEYGFEKKNAVVRVTLDGKLQVAGLFFKPAWNPPEYAQTTGFDERALTVGSARLPLPATLSIPKGKGPFPAIVLVHGSGPNDRDESIGPNKLFKDLAWGLASQGVAVLRFVKRTEQYRGQLSPDDVATVEQESNEDVRTAVSLLEKTLDIDPQRIAVAGHSLGALLSPTIAAGDARVRAIILLAGPTRSPGQIKREQTRYLVGPWALSEQEANEAIRGADTIAARLDAPDLKPEEVVDGIAGRYWIDLREHHGAKVIGQLSIPVLVLQGGRDYQVTAEDLEGWKKALAGKAKATFKLYPDLNHHFMPGQGPSTPQEYSAPNHVPKYVVDDLATWLSENLVPSHPKNRSR